MLSIVHVLNSENSELLERKRETEREVWLEKIKAYIKQVSGYKIQGNSVIFTSYDSFLFCTLRLSIEM